MEHYPLQVTVIMLSGDTYRVFLRRRARVEDLKFELQTYTGVRRARQNLMLGSTLLNNDRQKLRTLATPVCPEGFHLLADLVPIPSWSNMELEVTLVFQNYHCGFCETVASKKMPRCLACEVHYCNSSCQLAHWPFHKLTCSRFL